LLKQLFVLQFRVSRPDYKSDSPQKIAESDNLKKLDFHRKNAEKCGVEKIAESGQESKGY
jgi:hypothetical protein